MDHHGTSLSVGDLYLKFFVLNKRTVDYKLSINSDYLKFFAFATIAVCLQIGFNYSVKVLASVALIFLPNKLFRGHFRLAS